MFAASFTKNMKDKFSATSVKRDAKKAAVKQEIEFIDPQDMAVIRKAANKALALIKRHKRISAPELRRQLKLNEYCLRNWNTIISIIGDSLDISYAGWAIYTYKKPRILPIPEYNGSNIFNLGLKPFVELGVK